ncbi:hypothetical protein IQ07DRAFT_588272 [Pyrenochaeta sp. DS3sAY3a]|nr:hypothetical protein IQ07DRAFT_588272 [Pyrenochaeta sp. DS3sAY3a]
MGIFLLCSLLLRVASAGDISLILFSDAQCGGNIVTNVHSNPASEHAGSGCIAANFQSAGAASVDPGFKCNVYSDTACQNFVASIESTNQCETLVGKGASCFSQAAFDNPLANIQAKVTVGSSVVHFTAEIRSFEVTDGAIQGACGDSGCDPNVPFKKDLKLFPGKSKCTVTATSRGNYDSTAERDYMKQLIAKAALKTGSIDFSQIGGFGNPAGAPSTMSGFIQVVLEDAAGNNKAQMEVSTSASCSKSSGNGCDSFVADVVKAGLGEVPAVGGLLAAGFDAVCNVGT